MGIQESQFPFIWRGIRWWMKQRHMSPQDLARLTSYRMEAILRGIQGETEWLESDFVHECIEAFRLHNARSRGPEDTADLLTDEECVALIAEPLAQKEGQVRLW